MIIALVEHAVAMRPFEVKPICRETILQQQESEYSQFHGHIPHSQKTRNSKGFCEDNLPLQMAEQNSPGGAGLAVITISM